MKKKEKQALRAMSESELLKKIQETEGVFVQLLKTGKTDKNKNNRVARTLRTKLAILKTFVRTKEITHES